MKLEDHPTVRRHRSSVTPPGPSAGQPLDTGTLRSLCLEAGADDVGFVDLARPELDDQRPDILSAYPRAQSLISIVCKLNRAPIRSPARSLANLEFHHTGDHVDEVARRIVTALGSLGHGALNPSMGFPMEMNRFPGKLWVVSHKPVAVAAGLGRIGIHRNLIHPRFGNFVLLGTVIVDAPLSSESDEGQPLDFNPCLDCKLCVAACPVGAISAEGQFDFSACYTHNYREFMGGFTDWVEQVVDSKDRADYRTRVSDSESASMWQSLSFGANYKAAYCMAVCPAGEDVIGLFLESKPAFKQEVLRPLNDKVEPIYVSPGSDAEAHVLKRFPHKQVRRVNGGLRPSSIRGFIDGVSLTFQRGRAQGLDAVYHFTFTGSEAAQVTMTIRARSLAVSDGLHGVADLAVTADANTWLGFLAKERNIVWAILRRKVRLRGPVRLLRSFGRCFAQ